MATVQWCLHKLDFKRQLFCALQVTKPPWYITSIFWCWSRDQVIWEGCDMNGIRYKISEESLSICLPSVCCSRNIVCWHASQWTRRHHRHGVGGWAVPARYHKQNCYFFQICWPDVQGSAKKRFGLLKLTVLLWCWFIWVVMERGLWNEFVVFC